MGGGRATIHVHVERLVIDGSELDRRDVATLVEVLGDELARHLVDGLVPAPAHVDRRPAPALPASAWGSAGSLGRAAAASIAEAIRPAEEDRR